MIFPFNLKKPRMNTIGKASSIFSSEAQLIITKLFKPTIDNLKKMSKVRDARS
jgi:hypothetical protein